MKIWFVEAKHYDNFALHALGLRRRREHQFSAQKCLRLAFSSSLFGTYIFTPCSSQFVCELTGWAVVAFYWGSQDEDIFLANKLQVVLHLLEKLGCHGLLSPVCRRSSRISSSEPYICYLWLTSIVAQRGHMCSKMMSSHSLSDKWIEEVSWWSKGVLVGLI